MLHKCVISTVFHNGFYDASYLLAWDRSPVIKEEKAQKGGKIIDLLYFCTGMKKWKWRNFSKGRENLIPDLRNTFSNLETKVQMMAKYQKTPGSKMKRGGHSSN